MFRTAPATEPTRDVVDSPPADPIPLSVISLDLDAPAIGWTAYLTGRGIEVVTDDIGRPAIARADAKQLFDERRESEARKAQMREAAERKAIERDQQFRSTLWGGLPWYELPGGLSPAQALGAADRPAGPRRRPPVMDFLDNPDGGTVFHPITPDEE
jgi:hypothetical protein